MCSERGKFGITLRLNRVKLQASASSKRLQTAVNGPAGGKGGGGHDPDGMQAPCALASTAVDPPFAVCNRLCSTGDELMPPRLPHTPHTCPVCPWEQRGQVQCSSGDYYAQLRRTGRFQTAARTLSTQPRSPGRYPHRLTHHPTHTLTHTPTHAPTHTHALTHTQHPSRLSHESFERNSIEQLMIGAIGASSHEWMKCTQHQQLTSQQLHTRAP